MSEKTDRQLGQLPRLAICIDSLIVKVEVKAAIPIEQSSDTIRWIGGDCGAGFEKDFGHLLRLPLLSCDHDGAHASLEIWDLFQLLHIVHQEEVLTAKLCRARHHSIRTSC